MRSSNARTGFARRHRATCVVLTLLVASLGVSTATRSASAGEHAAAPAAASGDGDGTTSPWQFRLALYSWITEQHGTVTQGGRTVHVDVGFDDVFDLLGAGDALGGAGYFDVYNIPTRLGGFVNAVGSVVDTSAKQNRATFGLDSSLAFVEWGLTYRFWQAWFGDPDADDADQRTMWLEGLVGGRYTHMGNTITVSHADLPFERDVSSNVDFVDPIVGGRWRAGFPHGIGLTFNGDIGGFDAGSKLSWSLASTVTFELPPLAGAALNIAAGYRIISIDYHDGAGASLREFDLEFRGPLLGLTARF